LKAHVIAGLALTIQIALPMAAFCDDDSKWASGRDPLADFCNNITSGLSNFLNGHTTAPADGDSAGWGTRRGGWNFNPQPANANAGIVYIDSNKKVIENRVQVKAADGSRMTRRLTPNEKSNIPLKKMIDSGSSSYSLGSYGNSRYYPMGSGSVSGYRSGGGMRGWGNYGGGDPSGGMNPYGSSHYAFGSGAGTGIGRGGGVFGASSGRSVAGAGGMAGGAAY